MKYNYLQYITLVFVGMVLSGCEPSVESLAENTEKRKKILAECAEKGLKAKDDELCKKALEAQALAVKNGMKSIADEF